MLIENILRECDDRYMKHKKAQSPSQKCPACSAPATCINNCEDCLSKIHSAQTPFERKYDCTNMADFYTCKYAYRYTSELIYAIQCALDLQHKEELNVLSLGCGPCTDLFAIDYLRTNGHLTFQKLNYVGIDYSQDVWQNIHTDLRNSSPENFSINFFYEDTCSFITKLFDAKWIPDLIIFQYVFSDMQKHTGNENTSQFIEDFSTYCNNKLPQKSYIVLNDINLSISYNGGRDYFDKLYARLKSCKVYRSHFHNDNKPRTYSYGEQLPDNTNLFNVNPLAFYNPFDTCASAQMIIKKE